MTHEKSPSTETAEKQRALVMAMFLDSADDDDGERFLALVDHCGIDLAACHWRCEANSERDCCSLSACTPL